MANIGEKLKAERYNKLIQKLLNDDIGRGMLGRTLGLEISKFEETEPPPSVAILVPSYKSPHPRMVDAASQMAKQAQTVAHVWYPPRVSSCVVHWTRNMLISELLKGERKFDYVLFIDDDIIPPPDALVRMLSHKKDVVAAVCTRRQDPPIPNVRTYNAATGDYADTLTWENHGGLVRVDAVGTGMMLISRHALDVVAEFWKSCGWEKHLRAQQQEPESDFAKVEAARRKNYETNKNGWWFEFLKHEKFQHAEYGEDISFCHKCRLVGIDVFVDTGVMPGHIGDYAYSLIDFYPYQQELISQAKQERDRREGKLVIIEDD